MWNYRVYGPFTQRSAVLAGCVSNDLLRYKIPREMASANLITCRCCARLLQAAATAGAPRPFKTELRGSALIQPLRPYPSCNINI